MGNPSLELRSHHRLGSVRGHGTETTVFPFNILIWTLGLVQGCSSSAQSLLCAPPHSGSTEGPDHATVYLVNVLQQRAEALNRQCDVTGTFLGDQDRGINYTKWGGKMDLLKHRSGSEAPEPA